MLDSTIVDMVKDLLELGTLLEVGSRPEAHFL